MKKILFYDSGIGGLTTLKQTMKLSNDSFIYFADDLNCPYGNRTSAEIERLVKDNLKRLLRRFKIKTIVFACNTITTSCIDKIRASIDVKIVGTEPAIMPAARRSIKKRVLVIATNATLSQKKYLSLKNRAGVKVFDLPLKDFAKQIEDNKLENKPIDLNMYLEIIKRKIRACGCDCLVLGCTHYCFYKAFFERELKIPIFDGNMGVARKTIEQNKSRNRARVKIILSSGSHKKTQQYRTILDSL